MIELFFKRWNIHRCTRIFDFFTRNFFDVHFIKERSIFIKMRDYFRCWFIDDCYDVAILKKTLKNVFESHQKLFDTNKFEISSSKIIVIATTISNVSIFVFSNYNEKKTRKKKCDKIVSQKLWWMLMILKLQTRTIRKHERRIFRLKSVNIFLFYQKCSLTESEIESSQLRLCKSIYIIFSMSCRANENRLFQFVKINDIESFQNDKLKHNNSIDFVLWKSRKIWLHSSNLDVILFLKIDFDEKTKSLKISHFRHVFNDEFISRLCCSFMSSLNEKRVWKNFKNRLNENAKIDYFRFNIAIRKKEIQIDNVNHMKMFKNYVQLQSHDRDDRINIAFALLTTNFYFELNSISVLKTKHYICQKLIRCRNDCKVVIDFIIELHDLCIEICIDTSILKRLNHKNICNVCHLFQKRVIFHVRHFENIVIVNIKYSVTTHRKINEFSHNMLWFIKQQKFDASFDKRDHDSSKRLICQFCAIKFEQKFERKKKMNQFDRFRKRMRLQL